MWYRVADVNGEPAYQNETGQTLEVVNTGPSAYAPEIAGAQLYGGTYATAATAAAVIAKIISVEGSIDTSAL